MKTADKFTTDQDVYFEKADTAKYFWQTLQPFISNQERELLPAINPQEAKRLLEIGCGEGGNLFLLNHLPELTVGLDLYEDKIKFARTQLPNVRFVASDGRILPFYNEQFDIVLLRDVLHHVEKAEEIIFEAKRVLRHKGQLIIIETNGRNPLAWLFGSLVPAERLVKRNRPEWLRNLFAIDDKISIEMKQPLPLSRLFLHYRFGLSWLTIIPGVSFLLKQLNNIFRLLVPKSHWFYIKLNYVKE